MLDFQLLLLYNESKMITFRRKEVKIMKAGLHPEYKEATIKCACGNTVATKTTKGDISVEICAKCHPFFTGKQKFVDAGGRVDKFKKRLNSVK